jgi:2-dehydro-3-deoxyphosphooctonate aldolase (KDO 8-P synthase)
VLEVAREVSDLCRALGVQHVFKVSFDKPNRSSEESFLGPASHEGLAVLADARERFGVLVFTDLYESHQAAAAAPPVDVLQIPAFLCR